MFVIYLGAKMQRAQALRCGFRTESAKSGEDAHVFTTGVNRFSGVTEIQGVFTGLVLSGVFIDCTDTFFRHELWFSLLAEE